MGFFLFVQPPFSNRVLVLRGLKVWEVSWPNYFPSHGQEPHHAGKGNVCEQTVHEQLGDVAPRGALGATLNSQLVPHAKLSHM